LDNHWLFCSSSTFVDISDGLSALTHLTGCSPECLVPPDEYRGQLSIDLVLLFPHHWQYFCLRLFIKMGASSTALYQKFKMAKQHWLEDKFPSNYNRWKKGF
jgi:hypothetical protein